MKRVLFISQLLLLYALIPASADIGANDIKATGCSVIVVGSSNNLKLAPNCAASPETKIALREILAKLNQIVEQQKFTADNFSSFVAGANAWFPVVSTQLAQINSDIQGSILQLQNELDAKFAQPQTADSITLTFFDLKQKLVAGTPLTECSCAQNYDPINPQAMFGEYYPNQECLSGFETVEACAVKGNVSCPAGVLGYATPPWRRICSK